mmetsp:Transcript_11208/g.37138  ORF Transcript_11208/g.37138 Transcript_11208/m.37138 type:complete len:214 (+) Transcript_11208:276-917(+)
MISLASTATTGRMTTEAQMATKAHIGGADPDATGTPFTGEGPSATFSRPASNSTFLHGSWTWSVWSACFRFPESSWMGEYSEMGTLSTPLVVERGVAAGVHHGVSQVPAAADADWPRRDRSAAGPSLLTNEVGRAARYARSSDSIAAARESRKLASSMAFGRRKPCALNLGIACAFSLSSPPQSRWSWSIAMRRSFQRRSRRHSSGPSRTRSL